MAGAGAGTGGDSAEATRVLELSSLLWVLAFFAAFESSFADFELSVAVLAAGAAGAIGVEASAPAAGGGLEAVADWSVGGVCVAAL
jgi:hypothetical protein